MWQCPECHETVEPELDACWNCGTSCDGTRDPHFKSADATLPGDMAGLPVIDPALLVDGSSEPLPKPEVRFSLRQLMGAITVLSIVFAFTAWYIQPKTADDYFERGLERLDAKRNAEAIADFTRALELFPETVHDSNRAAILAARAAAHNNRGDYKNALADITRALKLNEQPLGAANFHTVHPFYGLQGISPRWRLLRANALVGLKRMDDAAAELKAILKDDPANRQALHLLAIAQEGDKPGDTGKQSSEIARDSAARE